MYMKQAVWALCVLFVAGLTFWNIESATPRRATLLLVNGKVYTLDPTNTVAEAVALRGGRIAGVGSTDEIRRMFRADSVIDLEGKTVVPGLADGHCHVHGMGTVIATISLFDLTSTDEILRLVERKAAETPQGGFILGRGWDQNLWPVKEFPTASILDEVSPLHPVILIRVDGHGVWVNSAAMKVAGITRETPDPSGGKIVRGATGEPTGVFLDNARELVEKFVPPQTRQEIRDQILASLRTCAGMGLTEVQDMGVNQDEIGIYRELADKGELPIRVYAAVSAPGDAWNEWRTKEPLVGAGGGMLTIRSVKLYVDGALGSRGAALFEEYSDDPGNRGITITNETELVSTIREACARGFQTAIHAIGDRANHIALDAIEAAQKDIPEGDYRPRIEHAQVLAPEDIGRFHALRALPSMEPVHATSDMYWAEARLGPVRVKGSYAWRSLLKTGTIIVGGSDFPNDQPNPLWGFYAACTRSDRDGYPLDGWRAEEKMTRDEALRCYTLWPAVGSFEEASRGTIEQGKWADLTVLSADIMTIAPKEILTTQAELTIVAGKVVYRRTNAAPAQ